MGKKEDEQVGQQAAYLSYRQAHGLPPTETRFPSNDPVPPPPASEPAFSKPHWEGMPMEETAETVEGHKCRSLGCQHVAPTRSLLYAHLKMAHNGEELPCPYCMTPDDGRWYRVGQPMSRHAGSCAANPERRQAGAKGLTRGDVDGDPRERKLAADRERQRRLREERKERVRVAQQMGQGRQGYGVQEPVQEQPQEEPMEPEPEIASDMSAVGQAATASNGAVAPAQYLPPVPQIVGALPPSTRMNVLMTVLLENLSSTHAPIHLLPRMMAWVAEAEQIRAELAREPANG